MRQIALAVVTVIVVVQIAMLGWALADQPDPNRLQTPIEPRTEPSFPLDIEGIWSTAETVALDWKPDATLVDVSMQIDWPREAASEPLAELPRGGWIFFAFLGGNDLLTLRVDRGSGVIVESRILGLGGRAREAYAAHQLDLTLAPIRSGTAAQAAETAYGAEFRSECPDQRYQSWLADRVSSETSGLVWHIEYESVNEEGEPVDPLTLDVDWATGDIRDVANADQPCA